MTLEPRHIWAATIPVPSGAALGNAISRRRRTLKLSQKLLGEKAGVPPSAISRLELEGDDSTPFSTIVRLIDALELDLELRVRGSRFVPRAPTKLDEFGLSPGTMSALQKEQLTLVDDLGSATSMLARPEFSNGTELYEVICALNRHGIALSGRRHGVPGDREREILRLRIVDGLTLSELARCFDVNNERIRQILHSLSLSGTPPTVSRRRAQRAQRRQWGR
jgi:transcriptional regulator with XRE-family HTH domain